MHECIQKKRLFWGVVLLSSFLYMASSCASKKKLVNTKPLIYDIASKTTRPDIITQSTIALYGYSFTIEYAYTNDNHSALRTDWRLHEGVLSGDEQGAPIQVRDRAFIHLSPRGFQGSRHALVASRIQFEMQVEINDDGKWNNIEADDTFQKEYMEIVKAIQTRLHRLGYQFN